MERNRNLAELQRIVQGQSNVSERMASVSPVLAMNRYRFGVSRVKAGSSKPKIILHPERVERNRRLAELAKYLRGV